MNDTSTLLYKVELLEDIVRSQETTLALDNDLLDLKTRLIELAEEESRLYRRENAVLKLLLSVSFVLIITLCSLLLIKGS
jgi:hypothetical protein